MCIYSIILFVFFKEKFDGYVFIDRDGSESQCLVEYSAYQKTPNATKKTKKDMKSETIDEDPDFLGIFHEKNFRFLLLHVKFEAPGNYQLK